MTRTENRLPIDFNRPFVFVGMMGAGKTHIGRVLAKRLGLTFVDTDEVIESQTEQTIAHIFAEQGEAVFRDIERRVIADMMARGDHVIATGGGAVTIPETLELILNRSFCIWVQADADRIYDRLKGDTTRPLLLCDDPLDKIKMLLAERQKHYERAHYHVRNNNEETARIIDDIVLAYRDFCDRTHNNERTD